MEVQASLLNNMLYLWQRQMPFNLTDLCKYRIVTSEKISLKTFLKLQMLLHLKFFSLTSKKVLINLQGSSTTMAFIEQIIKRCLNLLQSKTNLSKLRMSQMNSHKNLVSIKMTEILRLLRSLREVKA